MTDEKHIRFSKLLELHLLNVVRKKFTNEQLTPATLRMIRDEIRSHVDAIFAKSSFKLSEEARGWVANQYFKSIKVNNDQPVSDLVIINEFKLDKLTYSELELLKNLFNETAPGQELLVEWDRRSKA
jgi:hypothetical protein